jgi:hypothetical protein
VNSVTVGVGPRSAAAQPYSSTLTLSFNGGVARTLAEVLNALSPASAEVSCAVPTSAPTCTFRDHGHLVRFSHASSCGLVAVLVDGQPRASLLAGGPELDGTIASLHLPAP